MQKKYNKTWSLRMEALECRQMLSVMGAGTDDTATDYAQEMVASYATGDDLDSATMSLMSLAAEEGETAMFDKWDGTAADTSWYDASQTEFTLDSAADLAGLAQLVNVGVVGEDGTATKVTFADCTITLAANIDLDGHEWTPIGKGSSFQGNFDGGNFTVSNLKITTTSTSTVGLFGTVHAAAKTTIEMKDLNIVNADIQGNYNVSAFVASIGNGSAEGDSVVKISNINVDNAKLYGSYRTGAIVGISAGGGFNVITDCTVKNSSFEGYSSAANYGAAHVGAIAGHFSYNTINNCVVDNVTVKGAHAIGGVVGYLADDRVETLPKCTGNKVSNVTITAFSNNASAGYYAGAVIGRDDNRVSGEGLNNEFKNVTIFLPDETTETGLREAPVQFIGGGSLETVKFDHGTPVAQIVDANDDRYASFSSLQDAVNFYDAANKTVAILGDMTLTEDLKVVNGTNINSNGYNFTATLVSETLVNITFNGVTYTTDKLVISNNTVMLGTLETPSIVEKDGVYSIVDEANTNCTYIVKVGLSLSSLVSYEVTDKNITSIITAEEYAGKTIYVQVTATKEAFFDSNTYNTTVTVPAAPVDEVNVPTISVKEGVITITNVDTEADYVVKAGLSLSSMTVVTANSNGQYDLTTDYAGKSVYVSVTAIKGTASQTLNTTVTVPAAPVDEVNVPTISAQDGVITITNVDTEADYVVKVGLSLSSMTVVTANSNGQYDLTTDYAGKSVYVSVTAIKGTASQTLNTTVAVPAAPVVDEVDAPTISAKDGVITITNVDTEADYVVKAGLSLSSMTVVTANSNGQYDLTTDYAGKSVYVSVTVTKGIASKTLGTTVAVAVPVTITEVVKPSMTISCNRKTATIAGLDELIKNDGTLKVQVGTSLSSLTTYTMKASIFKKCQNSDGTFDSEKVYETFTGALTNFSYFNKKIYFRVTASVGNINSEMFSAVWNLNNFTSF